MRFSKILRTYPVPVTVALVFLAWACWYLRAIVAVLFGAYIAAAALLPAVDFLARKHVHRALATVGVFLSIALVVGLATYFFSNRIASATRMTVIALMSSRELAAGMHAIGFSFTDLLNRLTPAITATVIGTISSIALALSVLALSLYLLYDWHHIRDWVTKWLPNPPLARMLIDRQAHSLGAWVRGQLLLSAIVGGLVYLALSVAGMQYAPALGFLAALFELIPYAGPVLAAIPGVLLAFQTSLVFAIIVALIYVVIQEIEAHLLVPLIMRRAVYIHPIVIITSILVGFELMGIAGAMLAVPFVTLVWTTFVAVRDTQADVQRDPS